jgi:hypothetical protein
MPRIPGRQRQGREEGERSTRLRPGHIRRADIAPPRVTGTARNLFRLVRLVSRSPSASARDRMSYGSLAVPGKISAFRRRAVVNVRYSSSRTPGGWKAHGTYLERESAKGNGQHKESQAGLEHDAQSTHSDRLGLARQNPLGSLADSWQRAGDERIFKIIVSPEDGMADFERTTTDMIARIEQHAGAPVQWAGVVHRNTEHPHVHLLVRGRLPSGAPLKLPAALIRNGLREAVQSSLTRQLGPRTIEEIEQQSRVELTANRVTSLDRRLAVRMASYANDPVFKGVGTSVTAAEVTRIRHLQQLGLSKHDIGHGWLIRSDFLNQLCEMKAIQDRARTLFRAGVAISDPHAPMEYSTSSKKLVGRVLLNSEDEHTGALQTIFETTDGKIEIIRHDGTLRAAWSRGDLAPGNIVTIDSLRSDPKRLYAASAGVDKEILGDKQALDSISRRMRSMGLVATENNKGWMAEFSRALKSRALERNKERTY